MYLKIIQFISPFFVIHFTLLLSISFAQESYDQLSALHQNITDVTLKDVVYKQTFQEKNGSCIVSIKIINSDNLKEEEYECNLSDLNEYKIELNASKQSLKIDSINGEPAKYTNKIILWSSGIEDSRVLVETMKKMITKTGEIYKPSFIDGTDNPTKIQCCTYLNQSFTKVVDGTDAFNLELKEDTDNLCKLIFKEHDVSKDKTYEYKFDMNDINIHKINFNSSGRVATVHLETKGEKKYIEMYEQGTPKGYNNKIDLKIQDIENARLICEAFKSLSSQCSENLK